MWHMVEKRLGRTRRGIRMLSMILGTGVYTLVYVELPLNKVVSPLLLLG